MRRTRKWAYVAQEAQRLAALGLSPLEIATRLEVNRSTVQRWMATGKLPNTRRNTPDAATVPPGSRPPTDGNAATWAAAMRSAYALDATDEQLVDLAHVALSVARSDEAASVRLAAMGRFQALVKQLALVARPVAEAPAAPAPVSVPTTVRERRPDPRGSLMLQ